MQTSNHTSGAALGLHGLRKSYGGDAAVRDISLEIAAGEFVTLLGPSGSGKTTTLNMVAGFIPSDAGEIVLDGRQIGRLPAHKRGIGMVFQHYALFPHMTVAENVAFPLKRRKTPRSTISERVKETLELVRLAEYSARYPRQLSGGQQQRVALARAIVFQPSLLLMDEPLGALDKHLREVLQLEIKRIHRELGITFVYVTHDQEEAIVLSDRIAVFNEGLIEQVGTPRDLYEQPATLFTARFLGESNVFAGRIDGSGADTLVLNGGLAVRAPAASEVPPGGPCVLIVRPEAIRVIRDGNDPEPGVNAVSARVNRIDYLGSNRKLELAIASGQVCIAREQSGRASATREGDKVLVCWDPDRSVVLASDEPERAIAEEAMKVLPAAP